MSFQDLPIGSIIAWENLQIPAGWAVCDGNNGTPNLVDKFVRGAENNNEIRNTGGNEEHQHSTPNLSDGGSHNHGGGGSYTTGGSSGTAKTTILTGDPGTGDTWPTVGHTHGGSTATISTAGLHGHTTPNTNQATNLPDYITRVFIRRQE